MKKKKAKKKEKKLNKNPFFVLILNTLKNKLTAISNSHNSHPRV